MAASIGNLIDRIGQVAALVEAARLAAGALPPEQRVAIAALLERAGRELEGARQVARNIRGA
jgi:hypothetical protein